MAEEKEKKQEKNSELEKVNMEKIRGRVLIVNPEKSEIAKSLGLTKKGDYAKRTK